MKDIPSMIRQVIQTRQEKWNEAKALQTRGNLSDTENRHFDELVAEIEALDARADELHNLHQENLKMEEQRKEYGDIVARDSENRADVWRTVNVNTGTWRKVDDGEIAVRDFLSGKGDPVVTLDFKGLEHRRNDAGQMEVRDLTTSTASSTFGTDFRRMLYEHLVDANVLINAGATIINTDHGRDIVVPKTTAEGTAAIIGEGSAITEGDGGFGSTTLGAWKYANFHEVSNELIADAEVPLLQYLARDMGRSVGLASGSDFLVGTGTNQPTGLTVVAGTAVAGTVASGVDADELIDVFYSVATPYRDRGAWIMKDTTWKAVRKLKDSQNRYLVGDLAGAGPATLLGRPVYLDPDMPALGSANVSIAFGAMNAYFVRQGPVEIRRSDDYAFNRDVAALRITARMDGDLVDLTGAIKVYEGD